MSNYENTEGFKIIQNWMMEKGNSPFKFQVDTWQKLGSGCRSNRFWKNFFGVFGFGFIFSYLS